MLPGADARKAGIRARRAEADSTARRVVCDSLDCSTPPRVNRRFSARSASNRRACRSGWPCRNPRRSRPPNGRSTRYRSAPHRYASGMPSRAATDASCRTTSAHSPAIARAAPRAATTSPARPLRLRRQCGARARRVRGRDPSPRACACCAPAAARPVPPRAPSRAG